MSKTKLSFSLIPITVFIILAVFVYFILSFNICIIEKNVTNNFLYFTVVTGFLIAFLGINEDKYTILFRRFILPEIPNVIQIITLPIILITLVKDTSSLIFLAPLVYLLASAYLVEKMFAFMRRETSPFNEFSSFNLYKLSEDRLSRKFDLYFIVTIVYLSAVIILFVKFLQGAC